MSLHSVYKKTVETVEPMKPITISELMTPNPITIDSEDRVIDQIEIFQKNRIHHLPVKEKGEIIGMLSRRDLDHFISITRILTTENYDLRVGDIMTTPVFSYYEDVGIDQAAGAMVDNNIHAILVVAKSNDAVIGILTSTDLLKYLSRNRQYRME